MLKTMRYARLHRLQAIINPALDYGSKRFPPIKKSKNIPNRAIRQVCTYNWIEGHIHLFCSHFQQTTSQSYLAPKAKNHPFSWYCSNFIGPSKYSIASQIVELIGSAVLSVAGDKKCRKKAQTTEVCNHETTFRCCLHLLACHFLLKESLLIVEHPPHSLLADNNQIWRDWQRFLTDASEQSKLTPSEVIRKKFTLAIVTVELLPLYQRAEHQPHNG